MKTVYLLIALLATTTLHADGLSPFTTDGCSMFPDGTAEHHTLWRDCCVSHDLAYWQGGSYEQRVAADSALAQCVADKGQKAIAELMHTGVSVGGSPNLPTRFRWGYGWPMGRGYKPLTEAERDQVAAMLALE